MPKVRFKPMVVEIQGTMYDVVFKKSPSGKTIVTKRPDMSNVKWSRAQKENWKRMGQANEYAAAAMADPKVCAIYEKQAAKEHRVPYRLAVSDYFKGKNLLSKEGGPLKILPTIDAEIGQRIYRFLQHYP